MSNRLDGFTVVLADDMREDDAEPLIAAIRQLRGVASVTGRVVDFADHVARERARREVADGILNVLFPDRAKR